MESVLARYIMVLVTGVLYATSISGVTRSWILWYRLLVRLAGDCNGLLMPSGFAFSTTKHQRIRPATNCPYFIKKGKWPSNSTYPYPYPLLGTFEAYYQLQPSSKT